MKTTLLSLMLLAAPCSLVPCMVPVLAADESPTAAPAHTFPTPDEVVKTLTTKLSLTPDQASKILPIITNRQQKLKAIMGDASLSRMDRMQQSKAVFSEGDAQIHAILTPDQQTKYAELEQQTREHMRHHMQESQAQ